MNDGSRRPSGGEGEPTIKELERDFNLLVHGRADGKVEVENETPKASGGARKVVDDIHKGKALLKGSVEEEAEE